MPDRVLIVDYEPDMLRIVSFTLRKWGYEVFIASNGKEGLDVLAKEQGRNPRTNA